MFNKIFNNHYFRYCKEQLKLRHTHKLQCKYSATEVLYDNLNGERSQTVCIHFKLYNITGDAV